MGLYSITEDLLGLYTTPRLQKINKKLKEDEEITKDDIEYLIDESARFQTVVQRVNANDLQLDKSFLSEKVMIREVLKDLLTEIEYVYYTQFNDDNIYTHKFDTFAPFRKGLEDYNEDSLRATIRNDINTIKDFEKSYTSENTKVTQSSKPIKAVGFYTHIYKKYGIKVYITSETTTDEVYDLLVGKVKEQLKKDIKIKQRALDNL